MTLVECLLGHPVEAEHGRRREGHRCPGLAEGRILLRTQLGQLVAEWSRLVAQGPDRTPGLVESLVHEHAGALELLADGGAGVGLGLDHRAERLELERERRQRVREHVVDLTSEMVALAEQLRPGPLHLGPSHLDLHARQLLRFARPPGAG